MYKLLLSLRYLRTRFIALASIISVMLGVATMIVVNSVMAGFGAEMRDRLHNILADVIVSSASMDGVPDADRHMQIIEKVAGDKIEAMTPTVEVYGMMSFQYGSLGQITRTVTLVGIDPESKAQVTPLVEYLQDHRRPTWDLTPEALSRRRERVAQEALFYNAQDLERSFAELNGESDTELPPPPFATEASDADAEADASAGNVATEPENPFAIHDNPFENAANNTPAIDPAAPLRGRAYVGVGLISYQYTDPNTGETKTQMMVQPGDDIRLSTIRTGVPPEPCSLGVTVVDVLKTGMSEYDSNLILMNREFLQEARGMLDPTTGVRSFTTIQIKLKDYEDAEEVVAKLKAAFPPGTFVVQTWEDKQGPLLAAVEMESAILNVLLFLIIAVAGFGILAIFFMIVVEKTRDIGILKALGASAGGIMSIFLSYGLALGLVGSGVGVALGLLFVHYINEIESALSMVTGRKVFDEQIYYFSDIPTLVSPWMVCWVAFGAMTIAVLASILPARRAARLHPVESLRYE